MYATTVARMRAATARDRDLALAAWEDLSEEQRQSEYGQAVYLLYRLHCDTARIWEQASATKPRSWYSLLCPKGAEGESPPRTVNPRPRR